jgi:hypothetical protein
MVGVYDAVAELEFDVLVLDGLEVLGQLIVGLVRNGVLLGRPGCPASLWC